MTERGGFLAVAGAVVLGGALAGCAPRTTVILLPSDDARPAAVAARRSGEVVLLDQPYAAAKETPFGVTAYTSDAAEVDSRFGRAVAARPARPTSYTLYFVEGSEELTAESAQVVDTVLTAVTRRPVPDIVVVGHADGQGNDELNDALSLRRAESIRRELLRRGVAAENVQAIGRGKRVPAVPGSEGRAEPRNRRVEIVVR
jgi:outer membrane protein OmpA-like peptidoglycan-associated protein